MRPTGASTDALTAPIASSHALLRRPTWEPSSATMNSIAVVPIANSQTRAYTYKRCSVRVVRAQRRGTLMLACRRGISHHPTPRKDGGEDVDAKLVSRRIDG